MESPPTRTYPAKLALDIAYLELELLTASFITVIDIKTTSGGADASNFGNAIARYDYHMQAAWYFMAAAQEFGIDEEELFDIRSYIPNVVLMNFLKYDMPRQPILLHCSGIQCALRGGCVRAGPAVPGEWPGRLQRDA